MSEAEPRLGQRIDRWLWCARFFKSRTLAARHCSERKVRQNRRIVGKASTMLRPGDVLTFPQGRDIRVVKVLALAARRGPAAEARTLYQDLTVAEPETQPEPASAAARAPGSGRPTKRERRATDRLRQI